MNKKSYIRWGIALILGISVITPVAQAADTSNPVSLTPPKEISETVALPFSGLKSAAFTIPINMVNLTVTPEAASVGSKMVVTGTTLPVNTPLTLVWTTFEATWITDVQPNTVNYMGVSYKALNVDMVTTKTDSSGNLTFESKIPADFGGLHDIYAVINGAAVAHGAAQISRSFSISPKSGPIGTPFTVEYTGLGPKIYGAGAALLYDNKYVGEMLARWTRGTARATIIASGAPGKHWIQAHPAINYSYLNIIQSPDPFGNPGAEAFTVTKDPGIQKPTVVYPAKMTPTVEQRTTLSSVGLDPATKAVMTLSKDRGPILSKTTVSVTGLSTKGTHNIVWSTVTGNRFNCATGTCWVYNPVPLATVEVTDGSVSREVIIPDHLGGWHVVQIKQGDVIQAQALFYVQESIMPFYDKNGKVVSMGIASFDPSKSKESLAKGQAGVPKTTFKDGEEFTISVKGVGWTQMDNTLALTYDNAYIGYGCGFNSNGYVVFRLRATGGPGTHVINLRPLLYTPQPSFANTPFGLVPVLSAERDLPGLALGYQIPMMTFTINISK
jgi:hypothetical protein